MLKIITLAVVAILTLAPKPLDSLHHVQTPRHSSSEFCAGIAFVSGVPSSPNYYHLSALAPKANFLLLQNRTTYSGKPTPLINLGWRFSKQLDLRPLTFAAVIDEFGELLIPIQGAYIETAANHGGVAMLACT